MKKIKFNQLKINTDLEDSSNMNKNIGNINPMTEGINQLSIKNSKTMTATLNFNTLSPKNYSILQTSKSNKVTDFSKRPSHNNLTGSNDNRRSFVENRNEYKSNNENSISVGNNFGNLIGSLSPKIPNGIISKNRVMSPVPIKTDNKLNSNIFTTKSEIPASKVNNLIIQNNSTTNKNKKSVTNLISFVKENRNGANSANLSPVNLNKNSNMINGNGEVINRNSNHYAIKNFNQNSSSPNPDALANSNAGSQNLNNNNIPYNSNQITNFNDTQKNTNEGNLNTFVQEAISVTTLMNNQNIPLALSNLSVYFPQYESTKCSTRSIGNISAYAVNTYQGIIRNYNEDRVSIILNIAKPQSYQGTWPKCSFFGIYDGHGGSTCSDFLRDQLHSYVIKDANFPEDPVQALISGFEQAENDFINNIALNKNKEILDRSGSCVIVALIVEDMCYVANVGDSRAVLSTNAGKVMEVLSNDHKPNEEGENKRIIENGGKVYQTQTPAKLLNIPNINTNGNNANQVLVGPFRVFPGRLSVSRTFGDVEAKITKFGGIPGVVIATPEIRSFNIFSETDFLVLGCDGIYDQISNKEIVDCVWMTMSESTKTKNINSQCGLGADMIMKSSLVRRTLDNVTVTIIAFQNFEKIFKESLNKRTETYSPKSSFYLYNVIENKENHVHDPSSLYISSQPAIVVYPNKSQVQTPINKNTKNVSRKVSIEKDLKLRPKYLSPPQKDTKELLNLPVKGGKAQNLPIATNINYLNSTNTAKYTGNKSNKILSFEMNKKIVLSPKNKKDETFKKDVIKKEINSTLLRDRQYDSEKPISLIDKRINFMSDNIKS